MPISGGLLGLGALAEGLKQGLLTYRDERDRQQKLKQEGITNRLAALKAGYDVNPDTGEVSPTNATSMSNDLARIQTQRQMDSYDPNSLSSQNARAFLVDVVRASSPKSAIKIPENMSAADVAESQKILAPAITGGFGMQGREAVSQRIGESNEIKREMLGVRKARSGSEAGQAFENDKLLKQMKNTQENLNRAEGMLNGDVPLNSKNFNLLQQDLINATAPGGAATEGKINREMVETYAGSLNDLATKLGSVQDIRKAQPELVNQLRSLIGLIKSEYNGGMARQAADIHDSYDQTSIPEVRNTIKAKLYRYSPEAYGERYGDSPPPGTKASSGKGLIKPRETQSAKPKKVVQGGHTYILNEATGEYE